MSKSTQPTVSLEEFCSKVDNKEYLKLGKQLVTKNVGKSFSLLSLGLSLTLTKREEYLKLYLKVVESWSDKLVASSRYQDSLKIFEVAHDIYPHSPDLDYLLACTLYSTEMSAESLKAIFRDCFGGKGSQYCDEVWPHIMAVDQGIKPSFLWDVCTPDTSALLSLLHLAFEKEFLAERLRVVEVDLDVFIVNMTSLIKVLTRILTNEDSWLVDITESEPKIPSKETHFHFRNHLVSLLSQLRLSDTNVNLNSNRDEPMQLDHTPNNGNASSSCTLPVAQGKQSNPSVPEKAITIQLPEEVNLTTVFGCMLGYPQIYWWQGDGVGNTLSGVPLKVFKFGALFSQSSAHIELFSFSIPEALETELRPGIERWGNILNVWVEKSASFSETKFTCDPVLCLSVAL